jgi:hypothetical protein
VILDHRVEQGGYQLANQRQCRFDIEVALHPMLV